MTAPARIGRFTVRDLEPWDADALFKMTSDEPTMRYMGFKRHETIGEAAQLIQAYRTSPSKFLAVCNAENTGDVLGVVGFEVKRHQATVLIMFGRNRKARGAGREFSVPFVKWIFTHSQIWRVWAYCHIDNKPVQRVLERMGAKCEGRMERFEVFPNLSQEPQPCFMYAIVR